MAASHFLSEWMALPEESFTSDEDNYILLYNECQEQMFVYEFVRYHAGFGGMVFRGPTSC